MTQINVEEIKVFLRNKSGYLKEGGKRLRKVLMKKELQATVSDCKQAIREVVQESKFKIDPTDKKVKVLIYDIEVGYGLARAWRPSYKTSISYDDFVTHPKIICISYKWKGTDEVSTLRWDDKQDDKLLINLFIEELNKSDIIIGHNGDAFDLPWIRTRSAFHDLEMYPRYKSIDTLKIARNKFRFPSNRLDDLGDYLGLGRKIKTERSLWVDVIEKNDKVALDKMVEYCEQDVLLLEKVYDRLIKQELPQIHAGVLHGETKQTSPYTGSSNFTLIRSTTSSAGTKKYLMKCEDTNKYFEMSASDYKKYRESFE